MQPPFSRQFDDIYFSAEDGLAETRHTFLNGNGLPEAWAGRDRFTIAETGFGTGLNFLAAWTLFEETAAPEAVLDYVSVELYPLDAAAILAALGRWRDAFGGRLERLAAQYPMKLPGFHRIAFGRVRLTLVFDDMAEALPQLSVPAGVDAWFLDGFAPSKNPKMWTEALYREMARLSAPGATLASFTAVGAVRRGLGAAGFTVNRIRGYGRKFHMTTGRFDGTPRADAVRPRSIAVIGGGLAGTACAHALKQRGFMAVIYEREDLAAGASGNALGLCNPRFSARRTPEAQFYAAAYARACRMFQGMPGFNPCGSLHLVNSVDKDKRFRALLENWGWDTAHLAWLDAQQASDAAGVALAAPCLFLPQSMQMNPAALCRAYAAGIPVHRDVAAPVPDGKGWRVGHDYCDAAILAGGPGLLHHPHAAALPLHTVRGQVTTVRGRGASLDLKTNLCFGGYVSAPVAGLHMVGSSFQRWLGHTDLLPEDDAANLAKLAASVPALAQPYDIINARAGLRVASRDHFPVAGRLAGGLYISAAHGSHGLLSSLACAELVVDMMDGSPGSLPLSVQEALSPGRF